MVLMQASVLVSRVTVQACLLPPSLFCAGCLSNHSQHSSGMTIAVASLGILKIFLLLFCACAHICHSPPVEARDNLQELFLSLYHVDPRT